MKGNYKIEIEFGVVLVALLLGINFVAASGVSAPYWVGESENDPNANPLIVQPGETKYFNFSLQNSASDKDESFKVTITKGGELVSFLEFSETYLVPAGTSEVVVAFKVSIPSSTPIGASYPVEIEFSSSPVSQDGQFQFGSSIVKRFNVIVQEKIVQNDKPSKMNESSISGRWVVPVILVVLVVVVLVLIALKLKKRK